MGECFNCFVKFIGKNQIFILCLLVVVDILRILTKRRIWCRLPDRNGSRCSCDSVTLIKLQWPQFIQKCSMVTKEKDSLWIAMWAPFTPPESYVFYEIKNKDMQGETRINLYEGNLEVYDNGLWKNASFFPYMKCAHVYTHVWTHTHSIHERVSIDES